MKLKYPLRLRNPAGDLSVGDHLFLAAAHAKPPRFLALQVVAVSADRLTVTTQPVKINPLSRTARDYSTPGEVLPGAEIVAAGKPPRTAARGRSSREV